MESQCHSFIMVVSEKLRRRTGSEGELTKKERRIDANEYAGLHYYLYSEHFVFAFGSCFQ